MAIAIPKTDAPWPQWLPRPLYLTARTFNWKPLIGRDGRTFNLHARVFGFGVSLVLDEAQRRWTFALGARWLIHLGLGHSQPTPKEYIQANGMMGKGSPETRYVEVTVLLLTLGWSTEQGVRWFLNQRRIFHKRGARG